MEAEQPCVPLGRERYERLQSCIGLLGNTAGDTSKTTLGFLPQWKIVFFSSLGRTQVNCVMVKSDKPEFGRAHDCASRECHLTHSMS